MVERGLVETAIGLLEVGDSQLATCDLQLIIQLLIHPEAARLGESGPNLLRGTVTERSFRGERYRLTVRHASGAKLTFNLPASVELPALGKPITLSLNPRALALLPAAEDTDVE